MRLMADEHGAAGFLLKDELDAPRLERSLRTVLERSLLRAELEHLRNLVQLSETRWLEVLVHVAEPALVLGENGRVLYANGPAVEMFGPFARRFPLRELPLDADRKYGTEMSYGDGEVKRRARVRLVDTVWQERPAIIVLVQDLQSVHLDKSPDSSGAFLTSAVACASELRGHAEQLHASLVSAVDHVTKLGGLDRTPHVTSGTEEHPQRRIGIGPLRAELLQSTRGVLRSAMNEVERIRRLTAHLQRTSNRSGRMLEMLTFDGAMRSVCDRVRDHIMPGGLLALRPGAPNVLIEEQARITDPLEHILVGLVEAVRQGTTLAPRLQIRTQGRRHAVNVAIDLLFEGGEPRHAAAVLDALVEIEQEQSRALVTLGQGLHELRRVGGYARFGMRQDASVWIEVTLPKEALGSNE
jgi:hypothetical protein